MAKTRLSLMIIGSVILLILGALISYFILLGTNQIGSTAQKLEITVLDAQKEYDGTPLYASDYEIKSGKLLNGHYMDVEFIGSITDYGKGESTCSVRIYDEDNYDHTKEYEIKINSGELNVSKRPITLGLVKEGYSYNNSSVIVVDYDDDITSNLGYQVTSSLNLCRGHTLVPHYTTSEITEIDGVLQSNVKLECDIYDIYGVEVTDNYSISYEDNYAISINKPVLTFRTNSYSKVYDGIPVTEDEFESELLSGTLPSGYTVEYYYSTGPITDVNESGRLSLSSVVIRDKKNNIVTDNYAVIYQNTGYVNITPYEIGVIAESKTYEYDGDAKYYHTFDLVDTSELSKIKDGAGRVTGFNLNGLSYSLSVSDKSPSITDAGSVVNELVFDIQTQGRDTSDDFKFVYEKTPMIIINPKNVTVQFGTGKAIYTGSNINLNEAEFTEDEIIGIPEGYTLSYDKTGTYKEVGTHTVVTSNYVIKDEAENDVSNNYNIFTNYLTLMITGKPILVNGSECNYEGEYDGKVQVCSDFSKVTIDGLDEGLETEYVATSSITNVSENEKENTFVIKILDNNDVDVTADYEISYTYGKMSLSKATVSVMTKELIIPYNNQQTLENFVKSNIKFDIDINLNELDLSHINLGENTLQFKNVSESEENNDNNQRNYVLDENANKLTLKAEIKAIFKKVNYEYGDQFDFERNYEKNDNIPVNVKFLEPTDSDVGTYSLSKCFKSDGNKNYKIIVDQYLTISKKNIVVSWKTLNKPAGQVTITTADCVISGDTVTATGGGTLDLSDITLPTAISYCFEIDIEGSKNYNITYVPGTIIVTP